MNKKTHSISDRIYNKLFFLPLIFWSKINIVSINILFFPIQLLASQRKQKECFKTKRNSSGLNPEQWKYWWPVHPVSSGEDSATRCSGKVTPWGFWLGPPAISLLFLQILKSSTATSPTTPLSSPLAPPAPSYSTLPLSSNPGFPTPPNSSP